jgi:hypothetical protein
MEEEQERFYYMPEMKKPNLDPRVSYQLYLNSLYATTINRNTMNNMSFKLDTSLVCPPNYHFHASIVDAIIPNTIYTIDSTNQNFQFFVNSQPYTIQLAQGVYNGTARLQNLASQLSQNLIPLPFGTATARNNQFVALTFVRAAGSTYGIGGILRFSGTPFGGLSTSTPYTISQTILLREVLISSFTFTSPNLTCTCSFIHNLAVGQIIDIVNPTQTVSITSATLEADGTLLFTLSGPIVGMQNNRNFRFTFNNVNIPGFPTSFSDFFLYLNNTIFVGDSGRYGSANVGTYPQSTATASISYEMTNQTVSNVISTTVFVFTNTVSYFISTSAIFRRPPQVSLSELTSPFPIATGSMNATLVSSSPQFITSYDANRSRFNFRITPNDNFTLTIPRFPAVGINTQLVSTTFPVFAPDFPKISPTYLLVATNLSTANQALSVSQKAILDKIILDQPVNTIQIYKNFLMYNTRIGNRTLDAINITILDDQGNEVNFNGARTSFTIQIDVVPINISPPISDVDSE